MRYTCSNCGEEFNTKEEKPRCPSCLRKNGLIPADDEVLDSKETTEKKKKENALKAHKQKDNGSGNTPDNESSQVIEAGEDSSRKVLYAIIGAGILVLIGAAIGGIYWWRSSKEGVKQDPLQDPGLGALPTKRLKAALGAVGFPKEPIPFEQTKSVKKWSSPLKGKSAQEAAPVLGSMLNKIMKSPAVQFVDTPNLSEARLLTATQILNLPPKTTAGISSYTLASLALAAARASGHKATMVEIHKSSHVPGPPDPTGGRGRFGVAFMGDRYKNETPVAILDPAIGKVGGADVVELLTDLEALGHLLNIKSQINLETGADPSLTQLLSQGARNLNPRSATIRCGHGLILLALGGIQPAESMIQSALGLREDAPRHFCMAQVYLMTQRMQEALSQLNTAIKKDPKYAHAYIEQARIMLASGNPLEVDELLDRAESARPGLWETKVLRAMMPAVRGDTHTTIRQLQTLHAKKPKDIRTFFSLWQILKRTGADHQADRLEEAMLARLGPQESSRLKARLSQTKELLRKLKERLSKGDSPTSIPDAPPTSAELPSKGGDTDTPSPAPGQMVPPTPSPNAPPPDMDFKLKTPSPTGKGPGLGTGPGKGPGTTKDKFKLEF